MIGEVVREELTGLSLSRVAPSVFSPYHIVPLQIAVGAAPGIGNDVIAPLSAVWVDPVYILPANRRIVGWRTLIQAQINAESVITQAASKNAGLALMMGGALEVQLTSDTPPSPLIGRPPGNGDWVFCPPLQSDDPGVAVNVILHLGAITTTFPAHTNGQASFCVTLQMLLEAI